MPLAHSRLMTSYVHIHYQPTLCLLDHQHFRHRYPMQKSMALSLFKQVFTVCSLCKQIFMGLNPLNAMDLKLLNLHLLA
jgi:hypothetical protein